MKPIILPEQNSVKDVKICHTCGTNHNIPFHGSKKSPIRDNFHKTWNETHSSCAKICPACQSVFESITSYNQEKDITLN